MEKTLKNGLFLTLAIGLCMGFLSLTANATTYYVATNGDDSRNTTQAQSTATPWKKISKAASVMVAGDTCYIRGGTYRETVAPTNSGNSSSKINYTNYPGETVIVSGADFLNGWSQHSGNIYKATLPTPSPDVANQVFVNGTMYDQARWPNNTGTTLVQPTLAVVDAVATASPNCTITDADLTKADGFWNGATIWCVSGAGWRSMTSTISSNSQSAHTITFPAFSTNSNYATAIGNKYYITGTLNALDVAREWYYDGATMYIYQVGGGMPATNTVEVKRRNYAFDLSGRSYTDITGIKFFAAGLKTSSTTSNCIFSGLTAQYVIHGTVSTNGGMQLYGNNLELKNSTIQYSSLSLVLISGTGNKLNNCLIEVGDYEASYDQLVLIKEGSNHLISNNTIRESGRDCLGIYTSSNQIQYNDISAAGRLTTDGGIIYQGNYDGGNSRIHHNLVHDNYSSNLGTGIYLDNYSQNYVIDHNVVWGCSRSLMLNTPSNCNLVYNNTFDSSGYSINYGGSPYPHDWYGSRIFNNISTGTVISTGGSVLGYNLYSTTSPLFVNQAGHDYTLQSSSPAKDHGIAISGVTSNAIGVPDMGAYEYSTTPWTAGYNPTPPNPTYQSINVAYMNLVKNAGFETGNLTNWSQGATATVLYGQAWFDPTAISRSGIRTVRIGGTGVADGIGQTITGLSPNTTYVVSAWLKTTNAVETIAIGASNFYNGGGNVSSWTASTTWDQRLCEFTTGPSDVSAQIYLWKTTTGTYYVYADQVMVTVKDPNTVPVNFQSGIPTNWGQISSVSVSTSQNHEVGGSNSLAIGADQGYIERSYDALYNKILTVWFKDDALNLNMACVGRVDDTTSSRTIGVYTPTSTTNYCYRIGSTWAVSSVPRTSVWHQFKWDYSHGKGLVMSIDGITIYDDTPNGVSKAIKYINLGDPWTDSRIATNVFFDDLKIEDMDTVQ